MKIRWDKLLVQMSMWLAIEVLLNFVSLDDLADYSEFVFEKHLIVLSLLNVYFVKDAHQDKRKNSEIHLKTLYF